MAILYTVVAALVVMGEAWKIDQIEIATSPLEWYSLIYCLCSWIIGVLLIYGLQKRKHVLCMPWLIYTGINLIIMPIMVIVEAVLFFVVFGLAAIHASHTGDKDAFAVAIALCVGGGIGTLVGGLVIWLFSFYVWRVVQSEYLNIKRSDGPSQSVV